MVITNLKKLAQNDLRKKALLIAEAGYGAINIQSVIKLKVKRKKDILSIFGASQCTVVNLNNYKNVYIIGIGKDSSLASVSLAKILGKKLTKGIALDVVNPRLAISDKRLSVLVGTHPLPSIKNVNATQKIIKLLKKAGKDDLVISFICGGGSALLCGSESELKASQTTFKELTMAGADIIELNTVRKHLSKVKGGGLEKFIYPATAISLIVSDVLGNDISMVASGPTVYDKTTQKNADKILKKYSLQATAYSLRLLETEKNKKYFQNVQNILFVSNKDALLAMQEMALKLKLKPKIYSYKLKGEAQQIFCKMVSGIKKGEVVLAGGESTVKLNNELRIKNYGKIKLGKALRQAQGKGGRNQEAVLGFINNLKLTAYGKQQNKTAVVRKPLTVSKFIVISLASDGNDNNTKVAGAIGDVLTLKKSNKLKLNPQDYLNNHDSFNFFKKTKDAIYTSKNNFNVADLMIVIKE